MTHGNDMRRGSPVLTITRCLPFLEPAEDFPNIDCCRADAYE